MLLIDCGQEALTLYIDRYGEAPRAIYITHTHMDHVGGLERLFYKIYFDLRLRGTVKIYAHAALVPYLQARVADYPEVIAEGGANFWDAFTLVPVSRGFWHCDLWFDVFPTRHHAPSTSFGLSLHGSFVWTGDTRPRARDARRARGTGRARRARLLARRQSVAHGARRSRARISRGIAQAARALSLRVGSDAQELERHGYRVARAGELALLAAPRKAIATEAVI